MSSDVHALVTQARAGSPRAVARLITLVEQDGPQLPAAMAALAQQPGRAVVVGLTGPPGVGKSTTTNALVAALRGDGRRVGVLAVDPSSPFTGGALLGDRVRMSQHAVDPGVYIRSMASRGHLGGMSRATPQAVRVLSAAGFDVVLIETVGVGQSEVDVAALADTTVVLLAPGMGDGVQAAKAGILEIGDVFVVNKADRDGAAGTARDLRQMLRLAPGGHEQPGWTPPVLLTVAARDEGIAEVVAAIEEHQGWLQHSGQLLLRRRARAEREIEAIALAQLRERMHQGVTPALAELAQAVLAGASDPYRAAGQLIGALAAPRTAPANGQ